MREYAPILLLMFSLFFVFLAMKMLDLISWSWATVTSPLWVPLGIAGALVLFGFLFAPVIRWFTKYW